MGSFCTTPGVSTIFWNSAAASCPVGRQICLAMYIHWVHVQEDRLGWVTQFVRRCRLKQCKRLGCVALNELDLAANLRQVIELHDRIEREMPGQIGGDCFCMLDIACKCISEGRGSLYVPIG
jgi:hypothetical protein